MRIQSIVTRFNKQSPSLAVYYRDTVQHSTTRQTSRERQPSRCKLEMCLCRAKLSMMTSIPFASSTSCHIFSTLEKDLQICVSMKEHQGKQTLKLTAFLAAIIRSVRIPVSTSIGSSMFALMCATTSITLLQEAVRNSPAAPLARGTVAAVPVIGL